MRCASSLPRGCCAIPPLVRIDSPTAGQRHFPGRSGIAVKVDIPGGHKLVPGVVKLRRRHDRADIQLIQRRAAGEGDDTRPVGRGRAGLCSIELCDKSVVVRNDQRITAGDVTQTDSHCAVRDQPVEVAPAAAETQRLALR